MDIETVFLLNFIYMILITKTYNFVSKLLLDMPL